MAGIVICPLLLPLPFGMAASFWDLLPKDWPDSGRITEMFGGCQRCQNRSDARWKRMLTQVLERYNGYYCVICLSVNSIVDYSSATGRMNWSLSSPVLCSGTIDFYWQYPPWTLSLFLYHISSPLRSMRHEISLRVAVIVQRLTKSLRLQSLEEAKLSFLFPELSQTLARCCMPAVDNVRFSTCVRYFALLSSLTIRATIQIWNISNEQRLGRLSAVLVPPMLFMWSLTQWCGKTKEYRNYPSDPPIEGVSVPVFHSPGPASLLCYLLSSCNNKITPLSLLLYLLVDTLIEFYYVFQHAD